MSIKAIIRFLLFVFICLTSSVCLHAQQGNNDSLNNAQKLRSDSIKAAQQQFQDSMAAVRSYVKSKRYNDSIDALRKARIDSIKTARARIADSIKTERQRISDSIAAERQRFNDSVRIAVEWKKQEQQKTLDSIRIARQHITDSLNAIKAYRQSKHYKDSVARAQQQYTDSIKLARQQQQDSIRTVRQQQQDSMMAVRQQRTDSIRSYVDSMKLVREKAMDSLKIVRQARIDSLEKLKEQREIAKEEREKERDAKKKKRLDDKVKKAQDAYTNEKMLKKKWSFIRRAFHNMTTRYNYYFNAKNKMKEAEDNMFRSRQDNLDSLLALFPFDPDADSAKMLSDMDSLISRISVGIQIHDPRAKWQDDLFLLLGKAYYYKGDYKNAAASFQYIVANAERMEKEEAKKKNNKAKKGKSSRAVKTDFVKEEEEGGFAAMFQHREVKNDAILWLARVFAEEREYTKSRILLDMVSGSPHLPERLKGDLALNYANYYLQQGMVDDALPYLDSVAESRDLDDNIRERSGFLAGQVYQSKKEWRNAERMYDQVVSLTPPIEIDFKARINKLLAASNADPSNTEGVLATLKKLTGEVKYKDYFDQIYYTLANTQAGLGQSEEAISSYRNSISYASNNQRQKGMSYYGLGNLYYQSNDYLASKSAYDSSLMALLPSDQPMYGIAQQRSGSLALIANPGIKVKTIDSLLALSAMTEKEQRQVARNYIRALEKAKEAGALTPATTGSPSSPTEWYFANETVAAKGEAEFKQKWGNRPLKDNWRRSSGSFSGFEDTEDETDPATVSVTEDELLAKIPRDPKVLDSLRNELQSGYYMLGKAFFNAEDYPGAAKTYEQLLNRFPGFNKKDEVYYDLYLIALRQSDEAKATLYKNKLNSEFPTSEKTALIGRQPGNSTDSEAESVHGETNITDHFDQTYEMLKHGQFTDVIVKADEAKALYPIQAVRYQNKYNLMKAVAYAGLGSFGKADTMLTEFIAISTDDTLKQWASTVHNYVKNSIKEKEKTSGPVVPAVIPEPASYIADKTGSHFVVIYTGQFDGKFMGVKSGITDYNSLKKSGLALKSSVAVLEGTQSLIVIKEFPGLAEAKAYLNEIKSEPSLFKDFKVGTDLKMTVISASNFDLLLSKKNFDEYLSFYKKNY